MSEFALQIGYTFSSVFDVLPTCVVFTKVALGVRGKAQAHLRRRVVGDYQGRACLARDNSTIFRAQASMDPMDDIDGLLLQ